MYDKLAALPADLSAAIGFGNAEPRIERLAPYLERNLTYPVDERVPVDSGGTGSLDQTLMPFSSPLLTRLSDLDDDARITSNVTMVEYAAEFSDQIVSTPPGASAARVRASAALPNTGSSRRPVAT